MADITYTSTKIKELLEAKYSKDIFITECKTGPTIYADSHFKLDAWRMARSWKNQSYIGFEIKISRSDFLNDKKWRNYLPFCNEFYFVCPPGLIQIDELPPEIGLMYTSKNCKKLFIKKKSAFKEVSAQDVEPLLQYVLMSRVKVINEIYPHSPQVEKSFWESWLKDKELNRRFGHYVSKKISEKVEEKIRNVENRNYTLNRRLKAYKNIHEAFKDAGLEKVWYEVRSITNFVASYMKRKELDEKIDGIVESLKWIKSR